MTVLPHVSVGPLLGFPEHLTFPEFRRRYGALLLEHTDGPHEDKAVVEEILYIHEVDKNCYKVGLSQVGQLMVLYMYLQYV